MRSHRTRRVIAVAIAAASAAAACNMSSPYSESSAALTGSGSSVYTYPDASVGSGSSGSASLVDAAVGSGSGSGSDWSDAGVGSGSGSGTCTTCSSGSCGGQVYGDQYNRIGDSVYVLAGAVPDMVYPLTWTAYGLPPGLTISASSGAISGVISADALTEYPYTVTVEAKDSTSPRRWITRITFDWWISVRVDESLNQQTITGYPTDVQLPTTSGMMPPVYYTVEGLPSGLSASVTGRITGTVVAPVGTYTVTVEMVDSAAPAKTQTYSFDWIVSPVPSLDQWSYVNEPVSLTLPGSSGNGPYHFSAMNLPPGLSIDPTTGTITGTVQPGADLYSPYAVRVTTIDGTGTTTETQFKWTVSLFDAGSGSGSGSATTTFQATPL